MPRASVISCPRCKKTLAKEGKIKCRHCGAEVLAITNLGLVIHLIDKLDVNKDEIKERLWPDKNWIEAMIEDENRYHQAFFGQIFDLTHYREVLARYGQAKIIEWKKLGLEVHFLPPVIFMEDRELPGWKVKPNNWYWQQLKANKLLRHDQSNLVAVKEAKLEGIVVLVDTRLKPHYKDGKQMFANDKNFLGNLIANLRKVGNIARYDYGPQTSRFGVSSDEWEKQIKPALAEMIPEANWRLETAIEANIIPQLYTDMPRKDDGTTNTWVWYEEFFEDESYRLYGGVSDYGGLASVDWRYSGTHCIGRAFRPLGVLEP